MMNHEKYLIQLLSEIGAVNVTFRWKRRGEEEELEIIGLIPSDPKFYRPNPKFSN